MIDWTPLGIRPASYLLPQGDAMSRCWPVVALDQYTSQPEVWLEAEDQIGDKPSTLRLIVPEAFLDQTQARSQAVTEAMGRYLAEGVLGPETQGFILVERSTQSGKRIGLVTAIDLEAYDYHAGSQSLIRATEQTVLERIPARLAVREQAEVELAHVMVLVDDPTDSLLGPLYDRRDRLPLCYDLPLLMQGGHIRGWQVARQEEHQLLADALTALKAKLKDGEMLFAVGDGNHSLAAAKASWDKQKPGLSQAEQANHPARFAMVELVNLHSPALLFEPIHRVVFNISQQALLDCLQPLSPSADSQQPDIRLISSEGELALRLSLPPDRLALGAVQQLLDEAGFALDYVHGLEATREIAIRHQGVGILMPDFPKAQLFPTVQRDGRLPRKTFSMGEANEKRFYLEARRIRLQA